MIEANTPEDLAIKKERPFADPERFGALLARIDGEIEALARDRRSLAQIRRNVVVVCAAYAVVALCAQDALRSDLAEKKLPATAMTVQPPSSLPRVVQHAVTLAAARVASVLTSANTL